MASLEEEARANIAAVPDDGVTDATAAIQEAIGPRETKDRRHPAQVTADRLGEHVRAFEDQLTPREVTAFGRVILALEAVAAGER